MARKQSYHRRLSLGKTSGSPRSTLRSSRQPQSFEEVLPGNAHLLTSTPGFAGALPTFRYRSHESTRLARIETSLELQIGLFALCMHNLPAIPSDIVSGRLL